MALGRASTMYARALKAGVPDAVAHEQAKHLAGMLGDWIDTFEWQESQGQLGGAA